MNSNRGNSQELKSEHETKAILNRNGIPTPRGFTTVELPAVLDLEYPLVLKISDSEVLHKSDIGGVRVGIRNRDELEAAFSEMKKKFPTSSFLIEEMVKGGVEFIIGINTDPVFGKVIMLGSGGVYTELYHDVAFRKIPLSMADILDMLASIRSGRFCQGFRGAKINCDALKGLIAKVSDFVSQNSDTLISMDLNPVIVTEERAVVVDAKSLFRMEK